MIQLWTLPFGWCRRCIVVMAIYGHFTILAAVTKRSWMHKLYVWLVWFKATMFSQQGWLTGCITVCLQNVFCLAVTFSPFSFPDTEKPKRLRVSNLNCTGLPATQSVFPIRVRMGMHRSMVSVVPTCVHSALLSYARSGHAILRNRSQPNITHT